MGQTQSENQKNRIKLLQDKLQEKENKARELEGEKEKLERAMEKTEKELEKERDWWDKWLNDQKGVAKYNIRFPESSDTSQINFSYYLETNRNSSHYVGYKIINENFYPNVPNSPNQPNLIRSARQIVKGIYEHYINS